MNGRFPNRLLQALLRFYPAAFRRARGSEMEVMYRRMWTDAASPGPVGRLGFRLRLAIDLIGNAPSVWRQELGDDARLGTRPSNRGAQGSADGRGGPADPLGTPVTPSGLAAEFRHALKRLARSPGFTIVAVLTLALGVAANTSMFALVNGIYLKPLPFPHPRELVYLQEAKPSMLLGTSYASFEFFRERATSFESLGAFGGVGVTLREGEEPVSLSGTRVSSNLFEVLGVRPAMGRGLLPEEDQFGAEPVMVLSHGAWQSLFGGAPDIVGRSLRVGSGTSTVVGVMPPDFNFPSDAVQLWVPLSSLNREPNYRALTMVGRLESGTSIEAAGEEVMTLGEVLMERGDWSKGGDLTYVYPLRDILVGTEFKTIFTAFFLAVGFLFLIAGANLTNLLMARARGRERELALRQALGASRFRMILTSISEPLVLSLAGGLVGLLEAHWAIALVVGFGPDDLPRRAEIGLDPAVVTFAMTISLLAGLLIGMASLPGFRTRTSPGEMLSGSRVSKGRRLQGAFTVVQVALTFALLAGVGLMSKTVKQLQLVDPGFEAEGAIAIRVTLPGSSYPEPADRLAFMDRVLERASSLPGLTAAGYTTYLPLSGSWSDRRIRAEGDDRPTEELPTVEFDVVTPDLLRAMGISLVEGRFLDTGDREGTEMVAVINETAARVLFPDGDALGRRFSGPAADGTDWNTVVGVVEDVQQRDLTTPVNPKYYMPFAQLPWEWSSAPWVVMRFEGQTTEAATGMVRGMIKELASGSPLINIHPLQDRVDRLMVGPRMNAVVLAGFTAAALSLAALGLYAVIAFSVAERKKEIGLRMALGAGKGRVRMESLRRGMWLTGVGILVGIPLASGLGRVMASLLFGVGSFDLPVLTQVVVVLGVVSALACFVPSTKASRVDPMESLRRE